MRKSILALAAALAMLPVFARAGPVMKEAETQYALSQLADVAIANTRCDLQPPERVFLYHPISDEINFSCAAHGLTPDISLGWEKGAPPSKAWVALAVKAAQVITDEPAKTLRSGIDKCYRDALADPSTEMASVELPKSKIDCQAFARDGGAGSMTFYIDDIKDRANN
jgi:hypothetical protein